MAMMDPKAIGAHIRMLKPGLTALEHKVLDNIIAKPDFSEQTSLKEIAEENQVSEAMIVKIAKKLNFNGFREFRANLVLYRQLDISRLFSEISPDDNMEQLINKVFGNSVQALEETKVILNPHDLNHAADLLAHAGEILMFGMGGSAIIAEDLAHKFLRIGISIIFADVIAHVGIGQQAEADTCPRGCSELHRDVVEAGVLGIHLLRPIAEVRILQGDASIKNEGKRIHG